MEKQIFEKAVKLRTASIRGDIEIREFAHKKYNQFLIKNNISNSDVLQFENETSNVIQPFFEHNGKEFYTMEEFVQYYQTLSFTDKLKLAFKLS